MLAGAEGELEVSGLRKSYGGVPVLHGIELRAGHGDFVSLVGPSGCGKTTTLNIIAGFEQPDAGDVRLAGRSMLATPSHRRGLGMVFQSHALFPHMTVGENVGFGLSMRGVDKAEIRRRVGEALELVRLSDLAGRYPRELSGGQQQRVGIARALTVEPRLILMDEPLSSLDAKLRREMQIELRRIQKAVGITAIYVTHDQEEALTLSDRIVLMNRGRIEQEGTPEEIYSHPVSEFVAGFIGEATFLDGRIVAAEGGLAAIELPGGGRAQVPSPSGSAAAGAPVRLAVRPDRVRLVAPREGAVTGTVVSRAFTGPVQRFVVAIEGGPDLLAEMPVGDPALPEVGASVGCAVASGDWLVFGREP